MSDPVPNPPTPAPAAWHSALQGDDLAFVQTRGLDKLDVNAAAIAAVQGHRNAEKMIGIPPSEILRRPKDAGDAENWGKIHELLGVPKDPNEYKFDDVKFKDGAELDPKMAELIRGVAVKYKLTKEQTAGVARDLLVAGIDAELASETADYEAVLNTEREALKTNWGSNNLVRNMQVAKNAAQKLGLDETSVSALEKNLGYSKVMDMLYKVGVSWGEDKYVNNQSAGGGALTKEQAVAQLAELRQDREWLKRHSAGDREAKRQFENLTAIAGS